MEVNASISNLETEVAVVESGIEDDSEQGYISPGARGGETELQTARKAMRRVDTSQSTAH